jgi:thiamine-monophosphate kinase
VAQPGALPGEFDLIGRYFLPLTEGDPAALALSDDAALVPQRVGYDTVVTTDCMVSGTHFLDADGPDAIARKLLRVNLSDVAAMGATPAGYVLALALPRGTEEAWIASFAAGLADDQKRYRIHLLGGDTTATAGPLVATVTAFGLVSSGSALRRNAARPGDDVYVSGWIGDATLGLGHKLGTLPGLSREDAAYLLNRLHLPEPRTTLGPRLVGVAHAALDVSDGLAQDLEHIARASGLRIEIDLDAVPCSEPARRLADMSMRLKMIAGGDDYELAFTAPPDRAGDVQALSTELGLPLTRIGRCFVGRGVAALSKGLEVTLPAKGYQHF